MTCCYAGQVIYPRRCPWHGFMFDAAGLIGLANTHGVATLSADDDAPEEMLMTAALWFCTAVMAWRELR